MLIGNGPLIFPVFLFFTELSLAKLIYIIKCMHVCMYMFVIILDFQGDIALTQGL